MVAKKENKNGISNNSNLKRNIKDIRDNNSNVSQLMVGKLGYYVRIIIALLAGITVCFMSSIIAYSIYYEIIDKGEFPSSWLVLIIFAGPVIIAWSYVDVNKTLKTLNDVKGKLTDIIKNNKNDTKE